MKKKDSGGGANWMDTYGDMVTLLLCFFVLLYSMSSISEENWKALVMSFNPDALQTITATPGGDGPDAEADEAGGPIMAQEEGTPTQEEIDADIEQLYQALLQYVSQQGLESTISVTRGDGKVYVRFNETAFFDGDSYELRDESIPILDAVSEMLSHAAHSIDEVRIQGHTAQATANAPNNPQTDRFLASNRATVVLVYIQTHSEVDPARLVSEGFGQWKPVASNDTAAERAKNRRVEMIISGRNLEEELAGSLEEYSTVTTTTAADGTTTTTTTGDGAAAADEG